MRRKSGFGLLKPVVAVVVIGILGTIMVHTYRGYILRSYVTKGVHLALKVGEAVNGYYQETNKMPSSNYDIGLLEPITAPGIEFVRLGSLLGGRIIIKFKPETALGRDKAKPSYLLFKPVVEESGVMFWNCVADEGNVLDQYRPRGCQSTT